MIFVFDLWGDYAHFSHPATIYSSLTYPIPPKTTIMGILGAIGGFGTTEDYLFLSSILYSVKVKRLRGKQNFIFNGIKNALPSIDLKKGFQKIKKRKQFYRELLLNPEYRIYIDFGMVEEKLNVEKIKTNILKHKSLFPVYLGINFCLADFKYVGEFQEKEVKSNNSFVDIASFIKVGDKFKLETGRNYSDIRIATTINKKRFFGGWIDLLVELNGKSIKGCPQNYSIVNGENLVFI